MVRRSGAFGHSGGFMTPMAIFILTLGAIWVGIWFILTVYDALFDL